MTPARTLEPIEPSPDLAVSAKCALEYVCSGARKAPAARYYAPKFVDHMNDLEFHGLAGTEQSVDLYKKLLPDMAIAVEEQLVVGERVTSRFVVTGTSYGRRVRFNGVTISRFENGLIVEDWSVTDTLGMLRQLGFWRSLLVGVRSWRMLMAANAHSQRAGCASRRAGQNVVERAST